jgi:hypothetical protein
MTEIVATGEATILADGMELGSLILTNARVDVNGQIAISVRNLPAQPLFNHPSRKPRFNAGTEDCWNNLQCCSRIMCEQTIQQEK